MNRKPLGSRPMDPFRTFVFLDSCAFDPKIAPEDSASAEILRSYEERTGGLLISHSTIEELEHLNTPSWVKKEARKHIFTCKVGLCQEELIKKDEILNILSGNGNRDKMRKDAEHIFEAQKYGAAYFVTVDKGILKRRIELQRSCHIEPLTPSAMLAIYNLHNIGGKLGE